MPKVTNRRRGNVSSFSGDGVVEFNLESLVAALLIYIDDMGVAFFIKDGFADRVEFFEVFASLRR